MILNEWLTEKARVILILSDPFLSINSNSKKVKKRFLKETTYLVPKHLLPYQLYDLQSTQRIIIYPWNTYNRPWYFHHVLNSSDSADSNIFVSLFPLFIYFGYHIPPCCFTIVFSQGHKLVF